MLIAGLESGTSKVPHGESTGLRSRQKATLEQKQEGFALPLSHDKKSRSWAQSQAGEVGNCQRNRQHLLLQLHIIRSH